MCKELVKQKWNPMVSVVLPAYDVEDLISDAVKSVIEQTFVDFELIIVDDGSTDATGEKCDSFARSDARVHVIHTENCGVGSAVSIGIDNSRGKYLAFIDGDDRYRQDYLQEMINTAETKKADVVICNWIIVNRRGKQIKGRQRYNGRLTRKAMYEGLFINGTLPGYRWIKLIRRNLLDDIVLRTDLSVWEDVYFTAQVYQKCKDVYAIDKTLYYYNFRENSATRKLSDYNSYKDIPQYKALCSARIVLDNLVPTEYEYCFGPMVYPILIDIMWYFKDYTTDWDKTFEEDISDEIKKYIFDFIKCSRLNREIRLKYIIKTVFLKFRGVL